MIDLGWQPVTPPSKVSNLAEIGSVPRLLAIALAALGLAGALHALLVAVSRRRRDIAIARALGFTPRQARTAVCWQGAATDRCRDRHRNSARDPDRTRRLEAGHDGRRRRRSRVGPVARVRRHPGDRSGGGDVGRSDHRPKGGTDAAGRCVEERIVHAASMWARSEIRRGWLSLLVVALLVAITGRRRDGGRRRSTACRGGGRPIPGRRRAVGCHHLHPGLPLEHRDPGRARRRPTNPSDAAWRSCW